MAPFQSVAVHGFKTRKLPVYRSGHDLSLGFLSLLFRPADLVGFDICGCDFADPFSSEFQKGQEGLAAGLISQEGRRMLFMLTLRPAEESSQSILKDRSRRALLMIPALPSARPFL